MPSKRIFLKGIDYFQLLIDHHSKKNGGGGHEARLAIFLSGKVDKELIEKTIRTNYLCQQLSHARISKTFGLGFPSLYFTSGPSKIPFSILHIDGNEIPDSCLNNSVDVYNNAPLHIQLIYFSKGNSCLLFTFHHILFDFTGVQSFIYSIAGKKNATLLPVPEKSRTLSIRFRAFFKAVTFTFREANRKMTVIEKSLPEKSPSDINFKEITFSKEETASVFQNMKKMSLDMNHSIYYLASVSKSMHENIFLKQVNHNFIWVPVPVNFRKKGKENEVLFNGLSFLFYKLKRKELESFPDTINSIRDQMKFQMRNEMPAAFIDFADGYYYMPMPFYYPMMKLPSWGKLSSFSFSVLGNIFTELDQFMGLPVTDIKNYPSNSTAPGITFLFYEYRGGLKIMTSWVKGQFTDEEQDEVMKFLREVMLNPVYTASS